MAGNAAHDFEIREAINRVALASRKLLDTDERPVHRDQHPKQHGCVRARYVVGKNLEDAYRQGLFQHQKVYDAWIRFSNGGQRDDRKPDAHGMAVKLMGVEGPKVLATERDATTHDFVMVDNPTFFLRDAVEYSGFSDVLLKARGKEPSSLYNIVGLLLSGSARALAMLFLLSLFKGRLTTFLRLVRFAGKRIANPLTTRYWSTTPYKHGDTCMKFSVVPAEFPGGLSPEGPSDDSYDALADFLSPAVAVEPAAARPTASSPDFLREALAAGLSLRGAVFLFQVQLFKNETTTPIEDPTVPWREEAAPWYTVGRIWVPKQVFDTPGRMAFGENLSFTPWHAIPAHEPLGEINVVRAKVYSQLSELRHRLNGVTPREPDPTDPDPSDLPPQLGDDSSAFCHVLGDELDLIRERRGRVEGASSERGDGPGEAAGSDGAQPPRDVDSLTRQVRRRALKAHTTGLALAGEGPRGATFAVGFLQGLGSLSLIRRLDYLSAVSGGGHAAAWLVGWLKREGGDPENVERQLGPSRIGEARATRRYLATGEVVDEEPQPLLHLRSCARAAFPSASVVASSAWTAAACWVRNALIHLMVLLPLLVLVVVGARLVVALYGFCDGLMELDELAAQFDSRLGAPVLAAGVVALGLMLLSGAVALGLALALIARSVRGFRSADSRRSREPDAGDSDMLINRRIVTPVLAAALLLSFGLPPIERWIVGLLEKLGTGTLEGGLFSFRTVIDVVLSYWTLLSWPNFLAHALLIGGLLAWWTARSSAGESAPRRQTFVGAAFAAGVAAGLLIVLLEGLFRWLAQLGRLDLVATVIPALALMIMAAALIVELAALGRAAADGERAWRTVVSARLTKRAIVWLAGMATILYLPGLVFSAGATAQTAAVLGWLSAAALGLLAGRYLLPGREGDAAGWVTWLGLVAAQIFFVGLLGATALFVSLVANMPSLTAPGGDDASRSRITCEGSTGHRS